MYILFTENNLASFLTAVYYAYYHTAPDLITSDSAALTMLDQVILIEADLEKAKKVRKGITDKLGHSGYREVCDAYLSSNVKKEQILYDYLKLAFREGKAVFSMYGDSSIKEFGLLLKKVRHEAHRMHGFLRFKEMENGVFYCFFGSDNDILELVLPHFAARFNTQSFVLHDIKRKKLAFYDGTVCRLIPAEKVEITLSDKEKLFSALWKEYFENVSIADRENPRLQTQFAPKKYRWFMNEF